MKGYNQAFQDLQKHSLDSQDRERVELPGQRKRDPRRDIWKIKLTWLKAQKMSAGGSEVGIGENLRGPENHQGGYTPQASLRGKWRLMPGRPRNDLRLLSDPAMLALSSTAG